jgi:COMPASS component SWD3
MNMNAIGDDFVSFTAMDVSTSPDDKYILVSTDKDRLILYRSNTGQQVANFYGAISNEYSHPRHCWHPSGQYIYATSQNKAIHVWEVASQKIVTCLEGHSGDVRGLIYCLGMKMLFSCGFDGVVNVWSQAQE